MLKIFRAPERPQRRPELFNAPRKGGIVRPLAIVGAVCFTCLYLLVDFPRLLPWMSAAASAACLVGVLLYRRVRPATALLTAAVILFSCLLMAGAEYFTLRPAHTLAQASDPVRFTAHTISDPDRVKSRYDYVFVTDTVGEETFHTKIILSTYTPLEIEPYDTVTISARMSRPGQSVEGERSFNSRGIYLRAVEPVVERIERREGVRPPGYYIWKFRTALSEHISAALDAETGGLLRGILLGDQSGMTEDLSHDFRLIGISHVLSVSGLHMSVLGMTVFFLLRRSRAGARVSALLSGCFVFFFMALTGFTPSVVRSGVMMLVYLSSFLFRRTPDSLNSLGGAVFLLMLINPLSAADIGLTLSVLATFGIVTLHVRLAQWYDKHLNTITFTPARRLFKGVVDVLSISLCATAFTLPVILVEFNVINILAPISNLLVAGIASPAMVIGGLAAVFGAAGLPLLEQPLFTCAGALLRVMIRLSNAFADIPYAAYYVRDGSAVRLLLTVFVVTAVFWILMRRELLRPMAAYLTALAIVVGACVAVPAMRDRDCAVLQIVQGSNPCVLIRNAGQTVLIGSGREGIGLNLLELNNIYRLDFVFFWSDDSDPDESRILRRCRGVEPVFQGEVFHADFSDGMALSSDGETLLLQVTGRTVRIAENLTGDGADVLIAGGLSEEIDYAHVLAVETNSSYAKGRNALTVPYNSAIIITIDKDAQLALDGGP